MLIVYINISSIDNHLFLQSVIFSNNNNNNRETVKLYTIIALIHIREQESLFYQRIVE